MFVIMIAALGMGMCVLADQNPTAVSPMRMPRLEPGTVWVIKDSASCTSRAVVVTKNTRTGQETDRQETPAGVVTTELERQVTTSVGDGSLTGTVLYKRAVLTASSSPAEQPLSVQGKTFPFFLRPDAPRDAIKAEGGAEASAIASIDRVGYLLAAAGRNVLDGGGNDMTIAANVWSAIAGHYLGPSAAMRCHQRRSGPGGADLECRSLVADGDSDPVSVQLRLTEGGDWVASSEVTARRAKESRTKAATPDEEVVRIESRECRVKTDQTPASSAAAGVPPR
jgi:hypothetical protein